MKKASLGFILISLLASCTTSTSISLEDTQRWPASSADNCISGVDSILARSEDRETEFLLKLYAKDQAALKLLGASIEKRREVFAIAITALKNSVETTYKTLDADVLAATNGYSSYDGVYRVISFSPLTKSSPKIADGTNTLFIDEVLKLATREEQDGYIKALREFLISARKFNRAIADLHLQRAIALEKRNFMNAYSDYGLNSLEEAEAYLPKLAKRVEKNFREVEAVGDKNSTHTLRRIFYSLAEGVVQGQTAIERKKMADLFARALKILLVEQSDLYDVSSLRVVLEEVMNPMVELKEANLLPIEANGLVDLWALIRGKYALSTLVRDGKRLTKGESVVRFNNKVALIGKMVGLETDAQNRPVYIKYAGPVAMLENKQNGKLSRDLAYSEIPGQGVARHAEGFSSPLGDYVLFFNRNEFRNPSSDFWLELIDRKAEVELRFSSGYFIKGRLTDSYTHSETNEVVVLTFENCDVFDPQNNHVYRKEWGPFDFLTNPVAVGID